MVKSVHVRLSAIFFFFFLQVKTVSQVREFLLCKGENETMKPAECIPDSVPQILYLTIPTSIYYTSKTAHMYLILIAFRDRKATFLLNVAFNYGE